MGWIIKSTEGLNRAKRWRKGNLVFFFLELGHPSLPALGYKYSLFSGLWTQTVFERLAPRFSGLWNQTYITSSCRSQVFKLRLNDNTSFPGFSACRGQTVEVLGLHNCVNKSPLLHTHTRIYPTVLFLWKTPTNTLPLS